LPRRHGEHREKRFKEFRILGLKTEKKDSSGAKAQSLLGQNVGPKGPTPYRSREEGEEEPTTETLWCSIVRATETRRAWRKN
jgi:hypothetical protein